VRQRSIPNTEVPGAGLPPWERFENFVRMVVKVSKEDADKKNVEAIGDLSLGSGHKVTREQVRE
jgi:hypothetical protein